MKRLIFSVWNDLTEEHPSVPPKKLNAFLKYKNILIETQKRYATLCSADYEIFSAEKSSYVDVQFFKIFHSEKMLEYYDEVVYFDLDVIPKTKINIFNQFDNGAYFVNVEKNKWISSNIKNNTVDTMDMYSKLCCKNSMLLLDDISGNNLIANTGVLIMNKNQNLNFTERYNIAKKAFYESIEDNLYPLEISSSWEKNNEVFYSYLVEKYNSNCANIGIQWNFILDNNVRDFSAGAHIIHQVNKDFEVGFS